MMGTTDPVLRARLPWWPLWGGAAVVLAAALSRTAAAEPAVSWHPGVGAGVAAGVCAATAVALGTVAARRVRPRGPYTILGRRAAFPWGRVRLGQEERLHHVHCLGPHGSGTTRSILAPMLVQDLTAGAGVTVVDIQGGELCSTARAWAERLGRPILEWEPGHPESACWNPLQQPSAAAAQRLVDTLQRGTGGRAPADHYGSVARGVVRHAVAAFAAAGEPCDLCLLRAFLTDGDLRRSVLSRVGDPDLLAYFRHVFDGWKPEERGQQLRGLLGQLDALLAQPFVRRALCPPPGAVQIDLGRCLRDASVLLIRLPPGDTLRLAEALGGCLLSALQAAVAARGAADPPHYVYLNEFQHFCGAGFAEFLAQARDQRVGLVLAHQNLAQLREVGGPALEQTVLGNTRTTVLVRCDTPDAQALAPLLPPRGRAAWHPEDLSELPFGVGVVRVSSARRARAQMIRLRYVGGRRR